MKDNLAYVYPERSRAGTYKHELEFYFYDGTRRIRIKERIRQLKEIGRAIARSGVMSKPLDLVKVAEFALNLGNRSRLSSGSLYQPDFLEPWQYNARYMFANLMGKNTERLLHECHAKFGGNNDGEGSEWREVAWAEETWWRTSPYSLTHVLHQSTVDPGCVAYAESMEKLACNRYTSMKAGRYLNKFFGGLGEATIKAWAERQAARGKPAKLSFMAGTDKAGWIRAYREGPHSCMQGEDCVQVYAHPTSVLRLAYLSEGESSIMARCIVREDKKEWIRCYPLTDSSENQKWHTAMNEAVKQAGYTHGNLDGVHLDKQEVPGYTGRYIMPYLDGDTTGLTEHATTISVGDDDDVNGQQQAGFVSFDGDGDEDEDDYMSCDMCGDRTHNEETYYIEASEENVCGHCHESEYTETSRGSLRNRHVVEIEGNRAYQYAHVDDTVRTHDGRRIHEDDHVVKTIDGVDTVFHEDDDDIPVSDTQENA